MNENVDAQRDMEQRALRNVRGLVDKMESDDKLDARKQKRLVLGLVAVAFVLAFGVALVLAFRKPPPPLDTSNLPPLKGGPQR
jgi:hypothetical protein